ncbi:hypothetical protein OBBRIDRAFT_708793, partial [Obba rivulosa]
LHSVFHASLLEPFVTPHCSLDRSPARPAPVHIVPPESPMTIESFLDCRKIGRRYKYLVHWMNTSVAERSWVALSDVPRDLDEVLEHFHRHHPKLP